MAWFTPFITPFMTVEPGGGIPGAPSGRLTQRLESSSAPFTFPCRLLSLYAVSLALGCNSLSIFLRSFCQHSIQIRESQNTQLDLTPVGGQTTVSDVKADEGSPHD